MINANDFMRNASAADRNSLKDRILLLRAPKWEMGVKTFEDRGPCRDERLGYLCEPCVMVRGVRHDVWEINYALWGLITRSLDMTKGYAQSLALTYKTYKSIFAPEENPCRPNFQYTATLHDWLNWGWDFADKWPAIRPSESIPSENPRFDSCYTCEEEFGASYFAFGMDDLGRSSGGWGDLETL